ncbi:uncharacterized protein LOC119233822 [Talpa occidentalis]|uniref:uncharacterized protein LOC119233822 n=1 Tax=Talpa occidentalis TaxID=50954 RepID=UPI0023FA2817|nr:uncharacterized protein LOC119233822 [Talpa occidentalis]
MVWGSLDRPAGAAGPWRLGESRAIARITGRPPLPLSSLGPARDSLWLAGPVPGSWGSGSGQHFHWGPIPHLSSGFTLSRPHGAPPVSWGSCAGGACRAPGSWGARQQLGLPAGVGAPHVPGQAGFWTVPAPRPESPTWGAAELGPHAPGATALGWGERKLFLFFSPLSPACRAAAKVMQVGPTWLWCPAGMRHQGRAGLGLCSQVCVLLGHRSPPPPCILCHVFLGHCLGWPCGSLEARPSFLPGPPVHTAHLHGCLDGLTVTQTPGMGAYLGPAYVNTNPPCWYNILFKGRRSKAEPNSKPSALSGSLHSRFKTPYPVRVGMALHVQGRSWTQLLSGHFRI